MPRSAELEPAVSVVLPVYRSAELLIELYDRLRRTLPRLQAIARDSCARLILSTRAVRAMAPAIAAAAPELGALPWIGLKFIPPATVIGWYAIRSLRLERRRLLALASVEVAFFSLALLVGLNEALFGGPTPHAADLPGVSATGADSLSDYLGRSWRIVALTWDRWSTGAFADGFVDSHALVPYPAAGPRPLLSRLKSLLASHPLDIVIPTVDAELAHWIALRGVLRRLGVRTCVPTLTALSPNTGQPGTSPTVTLTGANFLPGMTVDAGSGITVSNVVLGGSTSATATFAWLDSSCPASARRMPSRNDMRGR